MAGDPGCGGDIFVIRKLNRRTKRQKRKCVERRSLIGSRSVKDLREIRDSGALTL